MTTERTPLGEEIEAALGEVLAHVRSEVALPCWVVDEPIADKEHAEECHDANRRR